MDNITFQNQLSETGYNERNVQVTNISELNESAHLNHMSYIKFSKPKNKTNYNSFLKKNNSK